jgi:hypothetical protein
MNLGVSVRRRGKEREALLTYLCSDFCRHEENLSTHELDVHFLANFQFYAKWVFICVFNTLKIGWWIMGTIESKKKMFSSVGKLLEYLSTQYNVKWNLQWFTIIIEKWF